jgi:hypothetical protein
VIGVVVQRARDARRLVLRVLRRDDMLCVVLRGESVCKSGGELSAVDQH